MFLQRVKQEYIKTIGNLINELCDEYDIYDRQTKAFVNKSQILNKILFKINSESNKIRNNNNNKFICNGIYKNGNRCNKNVVNDENYCKRHLDEIEKIKGEFNSEQEHKNDSELSEEGYQEYKNDSELRERGNTEQQTEYTELIKTHLTTKKNVFIEDSFYLIDDKYIYDKTTLEKVGYICKKNDESDFIFTEDPFLLGNVI